MDKEVAAFRAEVLRHRGTQRRGAPPYDEATKAKALRLKARLRSAGVSIVEAARRLGISAMTLQLWESAATRGMLVPVQVTPTPSVVVADSPVRIVSPRGYRIEVATVGAAAVLLREIG